MAAPKTVWLLSDDDFESCPTCSRRLSFEMSASDPASPIEVGRDEDGPIYRASCPDHGAHLFQFRNDELEDEDEA
jgi:hypothetical protein